MYGSESNQIMLFALDDGHVGYCKGNNTSIVTTETGSEVGGATNAAWFTELAGKDKAAPAATGEKKKSRQELRKTKRYAEKEAKRRSNGA